MLLALLKNGQASCLGQSLIDLRTVLSQRGESAAFSIRVLMATRILTLNARTKKTTIRTVTLGRFLSTTNHKHRITNGPQEEVHYASPVN